MRSLSRHGSSWDIYTVCLCCVASGETGEENTHTFNDWSKEVDMNAGDQVPTWRLDSWVKAFSHPGCAHL